MIVLGERPDEGISLRDYFAAQTLAAIANDRLLLSADEAFPHESTRFAIAKYAYAIADSMLKVRDE